MSVSGPWARYDWKYVNLVSLEKVDGIETKDLFYSCISLNQVIFKIIWEFSQISIRCSGQTVRIAVCFGVSTLTLFFFCSFIHNNWCTPMTILVHLLKLIIYKKKKEDFYNDLWRLYNVLKARLFGTHLLKQAIILAYQSFSMESKFLKISC